MDHMEQLRIVIRHVKENHRKYAVEHGQILFIQRLAVSLCDKSMLSFSNLFMVMSAVSRVILFKLPAKKKALEHRFSFVILRQDFR